jgi:hypothetical protein
MRSAPWIRRSLPVLALAGLAAAGCDGSKEPRVYRAPKDMPSPLREEPPPHDHAADAGVPTWIVPAGWKQLPDQQMRFATFQVDPADPKIAVIVYSFGPESGPLLPNVNRWEQQLGAELSTEESLPKVVKKLKSHGLEIDDIDLHGPAAAGQSEGQRMLAAIIRVPGKVWFLKFSGTESVVAAHKAEYDAFLRSIEFKQESAHVDEGGGLKAYRVPEGWTLDPEPKPMRIATFRVRAGGADAEVIVSSLPGEQSGSPEANVNRWRGQVGLDPVKDMGTVVSEAVAVGDVKGTLLDFGGAGEPSSSGKQILVVQATRGGSVWYFKLIGPASLVTAQKAALVSFVGSIEFAPSGE